MYEISVDGRFRAKHAIRLADGSFEPGHEHLWSVRATFRARKLDETTGVVIDFVQVREAMEAMAAELNGRDLNAMDTFPSSSPSAELVARYVAVRLGQVLGAGCVPYRVDVTEAAGCTAAYYPGGP